MPIALKKEDIGNLKVSDVSHTVKHATDNFDNRLRSITFEILESDSYYVVLYHMEVFAGTDSFNIDFVPKIKGEELGQFAWWNSDWGNRKDLFIDHTQVNSTLTNFPVLVYIDDDADMLNDVQPDLGDIVFVSTDNTTKYDHEIENFTISTGISASIWVRHPSISCSVDTHFNMYYNNSVCANQNNSTGVWDSDYLGVYHGMNLNDSTSNGKTLSETNDPTENSTGKIGGCFLIDHSSSEYYSVSSFYDIGQGTKNYSITAWFKPNWTDMGSDDSYSGVWMAAGIASRGLKIIAVANTEDKFTISAEGGNDLDNRIFTPSGLSYEWMFITGTFTEDDTVAWVNGTYHGIEDGNTLDFTTCGASLYIGKDLAAAQYYGGEIDEIRFSKVKRSDSWMETCYNNTNNKTGGNPFITFGNELFNPSGINPVTNFNVTTNSSTKICLNWTRSSNGNYTYIERSSTAGWNRGDGDLIYNNTASFFDDTTVTISNLYYYQAWAFNNSTHEFSVATAGNNHTGPLNPTNILTSITGSTINFTWTKGGRTDNTVIIRKENSYPSVIGDGTELYNGSAQGYDDTGWASTMYYTLYSYNTTVGIASSGANAYWGSLNITCKNASDNSSITSFWVTISNQSGSEVYDNASGGSYANINIDDLPTGDDVIIQVNATGYKDAIYYMDIAANNYYSLVAYLAPENGTNLYYLRVINEYDEPIQDVLIRVQRNIGGVFENVTIGYTDANGYMDTYLVPNVNYKVNLSKDGYVSKTENYKPDPDYYGIYYPKTFRLLFTREIPDIVIPSDIIHFNGTINITGAITIWYKDYNSNTVNTEISIYEVYNYTTTWNYTDSKTGYNDYSFTQTGYNTSMLHKITLYLNHSDLDGTQFISFYIDPLRTTTEEIEIEQYFTDVFGDFELGWVKTFMIFLPAFFFLIVFGAGHVGLGIMSAGMYLGFTTYFINISETGEGYIAIAVLLVLGGVVAIAINKWRRS